MAYVDRYNHKKMSSGLQGFACQPGNLFARSPIFSFVNIFSSKILFKNLFLSVIDPRSLIPSITGDIRSKPQSYARHCLVYMCVCVCVCV